MKLGDKAIRAQRRLEIAISLLQGKLVIPERDGYDPGGFRRKELQRTVEGALGMAEELLNQNEEFDIDDDPTLHCTWCGAKFASDCKCPPRAEND